MISHPHRCLYVHIPKTGGNSINRLFGVGWENHKDLARYAAEIDPAVFASYYKFAIARNPWERIFSDYNYQKKKSRARNSKLFLFDARGRVRPFRAWLEAVLEDPHRYAPERWGGEVSSGLHRWSPQLDWITLDGKIAVDCVLRLEHLEDDFTTVATTLHLPARRVPHRNGRWHWHYSWYYDDVSRERVAAYYARDIAAFGYRFESADEWTARLVRACSQPLKVMDQLRTASWRGRWARAVTAVDRLEAHTVPPINPGEKRAAA